MEQGLKGIFALFGGLALFLYGMDAVSYTHLLVHRYALFLFSLLVFLLIAQQVKNHFAESLTIVA